MWKFSSWEFLFSHVSFPAFWTVFCSQHWVNALTDLVCRLSTAPTQVLARRQANRKSLRATIAQMSDAGLSDLEEGEALRKNSAAASVRQRTWSFS